jgi:hypothetical protein
LINSEAFGVFGGRAASYTDLSASAKANNNYVYLKDSTVVNSVYVGQTEAERISQAINNVLTAEGRVTIGGDVAGGFNAYINGVDVDDQFSGNVFNVINPHSTGIAIGGDLFGFEEYNFYFSSLTPSGSYGLAVGADITLNDTFSRGSRVNPIILTNDGPPTEPEIEFILFDSPNSDIDYDYFEPPADSTESLGSLLKYDVTYAIAPRRFSALASNFRASEETVILPDGPSAGLDLINEGGDLVVEAGVDPIDKFGPDDSFDPSEDYGPDDGFDPLDDYGQDDYDAYGDHDGDNLDPLDRDGRGDGANPSDRENREEGFGFDKPYADRRKEARDKDSERTKKEDRRRLKEAKAKRPNPCPKAFFKAKGGRMERDDGRDLTLDSFSLLTGVDCGRRLESGLLTFGAAFEGGKGSYESRRSLFSGIVRGAGDLDYAGAALLGRFDFKPSPYGRFYLESSVRFGRLKSDFHTRDFVGSQGRRISYESNVPYVGFQFGAGDYIPLTDRSYLNVYAQYFFVNLKGTDLKLSDGQKVKVDDAKSHRFRAGAQFHQLVSERWRLFAGTAYEREADGEVKAKVYGYDLPTAPKKGGTGLFELGVAYSSRSEKPLNFSLSFQAVAGQRKGGAAIAQLGMVF